MRKYLSSQKLDLKRTFIAIGIGLFASVLAGLSYAFLLKSSPFIVLNVLYFVACVGLMQQIISFITNYGAIRHKWVKLLVTLLICLATWYAQWVFYTQVYFWQNLFNFKNVFLGIIHYSSDHTFTFFRNTFSASSFTGTDLMLLEMGELILFLSPMYFVLRSVSDYYCESCRKFNVISSFYITDAECDDRFIEAGSSGNFLFATQFEWRKKLPISLQAGDDDSGTIYHVIFSYCKSCNNNAIINITRGIFVKKEFGEIFFSGERELLKDCLMDEPSGLAFKEKFK